MKQPIKFEYLKEFVTSSGKIIKMKSLITQRGVQTIESNEDNGTYAVSDLVEIQNNPE